MSQGSPEKQKQYDIDDKKLAHKILDAVKCKISSVVHRCGNPGVLVVQIKSKGSQHGNSHLLREAGLFVLFGSSVD